MFKVTIVLLMTIKFSNEEIQHPLYSIWFSIASLFGQGVEEFPRDTISSSIKVIIFMEIFRSLSSKIVAASWWMFILLIVSCYTANLAAFLTVNKIENKVNSVDDLLNQNEIQYGVVETSSTFTTIEVDEK